MEVDWDGLGWLKWSGRMKLRICFCSLVLLTILAPGMPRSLHGGLGGFGHSHGWISLPRVILAMLAPCVSIRGCRCRVIWPMFLASGASQKYILVCFVLGGFGMA